MPTCRSRTVKPDEDRRATAQPTFTSVDYQSTQHSLNAYPSLRRDELLFCYYW